MTIHELLQEQKTIWGEGELTLSEIIVRTGVTFGDLCRHARGAQKDAARCTQDDLKKELGNIITSTVRWCDDLGFDPEECIRASLECHKQFVAADRKR